VQTVGLRGQRLRDLGRALPRLDTLTQAAAQRFDLWSGRLGGALVLATSAKRSALDRVAAPMRPRLLLDLVARRGDRLDERGRALTQAQTRRMERASERLALMSQRLAPALDRAFADAGRDILRSRDKLAGLDARLQAAPKLRLADLGKRLDALDRTRQTLGYAETLRRGYAVVRNADGVITTKAAAETAGALEIEFHDGRFALGDGKATAPKPAPKTPPKAPPSEQGGQGSLF
jgi:exodeoxyribonuclease VII large subunit